MTAKNKIVEAELSDGTEMLELIESEPAEGKIKIIYTRRPNAFESYSRESGDVKIAIAKDKDGKINAQAACIVRSCYINGVMTRVCYVSGLRKKKGYNGIIDWAGLKEFVKSTGSEVYFCSFLSSNKDALKMFTKKRRFMPELVFAGEYITYIINPRIFRCGLQEKYNFRCAEEKDRGNIISFLNEEGVRYNFSPSIENIEKEFSGLMLKDCYMLEKNGEILAFGALWNQSSYKQYIVEKYNGYMKILKYFSPIAEKFGYIKMPKEKEILDFPTLTLFYSKENNREYYLSFLNNIACEIGEKYGMFIYGISSGHPNNEIFTRLRTINFKSMIFCTAFEKGKRLDMDNHVHLECGLL
jgi:hypothetical protein